LRRAADFDNPNGGPPGVNLRHSNPCHPFRLHAGHSSSRDAKCQRDTEFLRERFSAFSQKVILSFEKSGFPEGIEQTLSAIRPANLPTMFRDNGIFKIGHSPPRKFLWLIPFMLAKKLLTSTSTDVKNNFSVTACGTKARTQRAVMSRK
jgi:hypothetical protein